MEGNDFCQGRLTAAIQHTLDKSPFSLRVRAVVVNAVVVNEGPMRQGYPTLDVRCLFSGTCLMISITPKPALGVAGRMIV